MFDSILIGNEVRIRLIDGSTFEGIFMRLEKSHVSTIGLLGVIVTIPVKAIEKVYKVGAA